MTASTYGHIAAAVSKESLEERQAKKRAKALKAKSSGGKVTRILQTVSCLYPDSIAAKEIPMTNGANLERFVPYDREFANRGADGCGEESCRI